MNAVRLQNLHTRLINHNNGIKISMCIHHISMGAVEYTYPSMKSASPMIQVHSHHELSSLQPVDQVHLIHEPSLSSPVDQVHPHRSSSSPPTYEPKSPNSPMDQVCLHKEIHLPLTHGPISSSPPELSLPSSVDQSRPHSWIKHVLIHGSSFVLTCELRSRLPAPIDQVCPPTWSRFTLTHGSSSRSYTKINKFHHRLHIRFLNRPAG